MHPLTKTEYDFLIRILLHANAGWYRATVEEGTMTDQQWQANIHLTSSLLSKVTQE